MPGVSLNIESFHFSIRCASTRLISLNSLPHVNMFYLRRILPRSCRKGRKLCEEQRSLAGGQDGRDSY